MTPEGWTAEAERERDKAIAEVARQQALRVENGKRFEQMRSERTAALSRAEAAEAAIERVRAIHYPFTPQLCYMNAQGGQTPMTSVHCHHCKPEGSGMVGDPDTWPCPTAAALDGADAEGKLR